jgi:hypothetical protein
MKRVGEMEDAAKITTDLKEAVRHLAENVAILHQAVVKMTAQRNEAMPGSVRVMILIPSVFITLSTLVWLFEHAGPMFK